MYHQVDRFSRPPAHRSTYCHVKRFKAQMRYLKLIGLPVLSLAEAFAIICEGRSFRGHAVVLTFDDGYQNFHEHAFPTLTRYGFPATVFVVTALMGQPSEWFAEDGRDTPPIMAASTIRELQEKNITFGPHTLSHPRLSRIDRDAMRYEIIESKHQMELVLGETTPFFCYPYGDYDETVVSAVAEAGFKGALSCIRGSAYPGREDPFLLPRKAISYGDSLLGFWWKLHMKNRKKTAIASC